MVRLMKHEEASELLGAYALDAVEPGEAEAVDAHLATCPRCRDELRTHREVVGLLAYAGQEAPEGLWDRVVAGIHDPADEAPSFEVPRSMRLIRPELPSVSPAEPDVAVAPGSQRVTSRSSPALRRWGRLYRFSTLVAAAAVVVVALLGVEVLRLQHRTDHLSGQVTAMAQGPTMATVRQALSVPGAQRVALQPVAGGPARLQAVILPGGQGYLYDSTLAPLTAARTYQLWGVVGDQRISYGVLGSSPERVVPFVASAGVKALAVTAEVAGGVVTSTQEPLAVGLVS